MLEFTVKIHGDDKTAEEVYEALHAALTKGRLDAVLEAALKKGPRDVELSPFRKSPEPRRRKFLQAKYFLEDAFEGFAKNEGQPANHLIGMAEERGIKESTLRDAKSDLKMASKRRGPRDEWRWFRPGTKEDPPRTRPGEIPDL